MVGEDLLLPQVLRWKFFGVPKKGLNNSKFRITFYLLPVMNTSINLLKISQLVTQLDLNWKLTLVVGLILQMMNSAENTSLIFEQINNLTRIIAMY